MNSSLYFLCVNKERTLLSECLSYNLLFATYNVDAWSCDGLNTAAGEVVYNLCTLLNNNIFN